MDCLPPVASELEVRVGIVVTLVSRLLPLRRTILRKGRCSDDGRESRDGKKLFHGYSPGYGGAIAARTQRRPIEASGEVRRHELELIAARHIATTPWCR